MNPSLAGFETYLLRERKPRTVRMYVETMRRLLHGVHPFTRDNIEALFVSNLKNGSWTGRYCNIQIIVLAAWSKYTGENFIFKEFRETSFSKATMSDEEIESFLALVCPQSQFTRGTKQLSPSWIRWRRMTMFWSLLSFTGARTGEIAHLEVDHVDWGRSVLIFEDTKTNEPRVVPIPPNIKEDLREYITTCTRYLFPSMRGGNTNDPVIDSVDWHYDFHKRRKMIGIVRKNLTPYSLRHSFITRLLEEDVNIFKVQKIVGHKRLDTTARYTHLTQKDMQETVKKLPLIRKSSDPKDILKAMSDTIKGFQLEKDSRFTYSIRETEESLEVTIRIITKQKQE